MTHMYQNKDTADNQLISVYRSEVTNLSVNLSTCTFQPVLQPRFILLTEISSSIPQVPCIFDAGYEIE